MINGRYYLDDFSDKNLTLEQKIFNFIGWYIATEVKEPNIVYININNQLNLDTIAGLKIRYERYVPQKIYWIGIENDHNEFSVQN